MSRSFKGSGWSCILSVFLFGYFGLMSVQASPRWGEFGGNLDYLRKTFTGPRAGIDNNCYIDMLDGSFLHFARVHGLTNMQALFVVSHGMSLDANVGRRYAFSPQTSFINAPRYSVADIARLVGNEKARQIRIIVLAGCNQDNILSSRELKHYFPNATTIIHAAPRTDASLATFWEMLTHGSQELLPIPNPGESPRHLGGSSSAKLTGYVAELFRPGERKPYRTQPAGRELLDRPAGVPELAIK